MSTGQFAKEKCSFPDLKIKFKIKNAAHYGVLLLALAAGFSQVKKRDFHSFKIERRRKHIYKAIFGVQ